ncbi:MAG TPA: galactokinase [Nocardioidaceae bacterium]|nr:galactokinase [Nocardioidaceae bacterium]
MNGGVWVAPGRVNLIGEHTDYNDGFVLPLAIPQRCRVRATTRDDGRVRASSAQRPGEPASFGVDTRPGDVSGWAAYVAGVVWSFRRAGHDVPGMDLAVDSDVPAGAGLSSSAALECAVAAAVNDLADLGLDRSALARLAQRAENDYVGVPCGVMDQMAAMHGAPGRLVLLDTRTEAVEHVPLDLGAAGLALLIVDTRAPHRLVGGEYAERRRECEQAARHLGVPALRDATREQVECSGLPDTLRRRARHVVTESARVLDVVDTLRSGADPRAIGVALSASHTSLRADFEVTVPELDVAVESALTAGAHGARMTGGGFGGSALALVDSGTAPRVAGAVADAFAARGFQAPQSCTVEPAAGVHRLADPAA